MSVTPSSDNQVITASGVSFSYGNHSVLKDVSFAVEKGDYVGIIGPNGSGKTTLLKLILGLLEPNSGDVSLYDGPPRALKERWRLGYVPQRITQLDINFPATVEEVIESGQVATSKISHSAMEHAYKVTGLTGLKSRLIGRISGGERQRVFIARALVANPEVLILDEPTVGVDVASQEQFYTLLCELNKKHGLTIVLVSHDIDVVAQEVKSMLFLNQTVVAAGKPRELMKEKYLEKLYGENVKFIEHKH